MFNVTEALTKKWAPIMESADAPAITDAYRRDVTISLLEAQSQDNKTTFTEDSNTVASGNVTNWDPILIALVRRAMPNNIGFDIAGVQPMTSPVQQIFAMRSQKFDTVDDVSTKSEVFMDKPNTAFSGKYATTAAEALSGSHSADGSPPVSNGGFKKMGFTIDKATATAKSRALRADYTQELAQDLKAVHGLDAESELAGILSTEILSEMNQEVIDTVNVKAFVGAQDTTVAGTFDLLADADGRWAVERFKSLQFQIEMEANAIGIATRRGRGNWIVCSANVASALSAAGVLNTPAPLSSGLNVETNGSTFAGNLGTMKVYIDPYAASDYVTVGYKGANPYDAGLFYCPYVPLTMMRAVGENDFQPRIGFKTRYAMIANPFVTTEAGVTDEIGNDGENPYFRTFQVTSINQGV